MVAEPSAAILATVKGLVVDQAAGKVIDALRQRDVRPILLKGASFARWLYGDGGARPYSDVDLLVAPDQQATASEVLAGLGYVLRCAEAAHGEQADHATNWDRPGSPTIDLHNTMSARLGVGPLRCWEVVSAQARPAVVGGIPAEVLAPEALALHVVLHAEVGKTKTLDDLGRALTRLSPSDWQRTMELAEALDALPAFGIGLRLHAEGEAMAAALGVPDDPTVELMLQASSTATLARPFEEVARARGIRGKASLVIRELIPTPSFVRLWFPPARRSRLGLVAGYLYRLVWVPWHAPRGLQSWRRARRAVAAGRSVTATPPGGHPPSPTTTTQQARRGS
ncbi:MAG: hypothetical protein AVDCRST_MAG76-1944 [uncultured Acidimicrobiales bacterium]|uniref:Nucleotidyltransferase family protein n=1 Tax=uncultured Acidimicrobiales bacterium TaxID=310071 RepID=A0A6J4I6X4_9ACTN|nr:MAG: hypothetical protein AVDCRST_MAG76-1944 [uncultured Acidimicrobiales bacterium]